MRLCTHHRTKKWLLLIAWQLSAIGYAHAQFNPTQLPGLRMWLRSDQGVQLNGTFVSQWTDQSGNGNHAASSPNAYRPVYTPDAINGLPALSFDGIDDFLQFPEIADVRTVFWVIREHPEANSSTSRPLLGWNGGLNFLRGDNMQLWNGLYASPQVFNGQTRLNGNNVVGTNALLLPGFNVVGLRTAGAVQASHLTQEANIFYRTWWGDFAELIVFDEPLSDAQMAQVEAYLFDRYVPVYSGIADIDMGAQLCDTVMCIPPHFTNVVWNGTTPGSCTTISSSGTYSVSFKDAFQRNYADTFEVHYAFDNIAMSDTVCEGQTYLWGNTDYAFDYFLNGVDVESIALSQPGSYSIDIMDATGCSKTVGLQLMSDAFASSYGIAPQPLYCAGAVLQIEPDLPPSTTVLWNGSVNANTIEVTTGGQYVVEAYNALGCVVRDTLAVDLAGASSALELQMDGQCAGTAVVLNAEAISGDPLVSGEWRFGDNTEAQVLSVSHTYANAGTYMVEFTGINTAGCTSYATSELIIHALPQLDFAVEGQCSNTPLLFESNAVSTDGEIVSYNWLIDGVFYEGQQVEVVVDGPGQIAALVAATTSFGCSAEWNGTHTVYAPPTIEAFADSVCVGDLSQMHWDLMQSGDGSPSTAVVWHFGDGAESSQAEPFHYYTYPGAYTAEAMTTNSSGCTDTTEVLAVVFDEPEADYLISNFCVNEPQVLLDASTAAQGDPIVSWLWTVDGTTQLTGQQPQLTLASEGLHPIALEVLTTAGCSARMEQQVPVWPVPAVQFSWTPLLAEAPWEVTFLATSDREVDCTWYFGEGNTGQGTPVEHLYAMNGTYNVVLTGTTPQGCSQSTSQIITVAAPLKDIAIEALELQPTADGSLIQVRVTNTGNVDLDNVVMSWQLGGDAKVQEPWLAGLAPGATAIYTFQSRVTPDGALWPYFCVYAETNAWLVAETNLTDNAYCKPLEMGGLELLPPFPNPGDERMFVRLISPSTGLAQMHVIDQKGTEVMRFEDLDVSKGFQQFFIDISELPNGAYQLMVFMDQSKSVVSFLKIASK